MVEDDVERQEDNKINDDLVLTPERKVEDNESAADDDQNNQFLSNLLTDEKIDRDNFLMTPGVKEHRKTAVTPAQSNRKLSIA